MKELAPQEEGGVEEEKKRRQKKRKIKLASAKRLNYAPPVRPRRIPLAAHSRDRKSVEVWNTEKVDRYLNKWSTPNR